VVGDEGVDAMSRYAHWYIIGFGISSVAAIWWGYYGIVVLNAFCVLGICAEEICQAIKKRNG
jgi:hypothetical protein